MGLIDLYLGPRKDMILPEDLDRYDDGNWLCDQKIDGCFGILETDSFGVVTRIMSRTGQQFSDVDGIVGRTLGLANTRFAGEFEVITQASCKAVSKNGYRRFWAFDLICLLGHDIRHLPIEQRRLLLEKSMSAISDNRLITRIVLVRQVDKGFRNFFKETIAQGHEGVVLKRRGSVYKSTTGNGRTDNWIRGKNIPTTDLYVLGIGKTDSRADNLSLGIWKNDKVEFVQSLAVPKGYSAKEMVGMVIECEYDVQMSSGTFRHLRFKRPRPDKTKEMCT